MENALPGGRRAAAPQGKYLRIGGPVLHPANRIKRYIFLFFRGRDGPNPSLGESPAGAAPDREPLQPLANSLRFYLTLAVGVPHTSLVDEDNGFTLPTRSYKALKALLLRVEGG